MCVYQCLVVEKVFIKYQNQNLEREKYSVWLLRNSAIIKINFVSKSHYTVENDSNLSQSNSISLSNRLSLSLSQTADQHNRFPNFSKLGIWVWSDSSVLILAKCFLFIYFLYQFFFFNSEIYLKKRKKKKSQNDVVLAQLTVGHNYGLTEYQIDNN